MGLNHFLDVEEMTDYAESKGLPAAGVGVTAYGTLLVLGGLGVVAFPVLSAGALATFLLVAAVTMHDFRAVPADRQQTEMTNFLKNVGLAGGTIALLALGGEGSTYALNVELW